MNHTIRISLIAFALLSAAIFFYVHANAVRETKNSSTTKGVPLYTYKIVNTYPHDVNAFTQGLVFGDGFLYEGTGMNGNSSIRKVKLETGDILQIRALPPKFFGEGITIYKNKIIQLTWRSKVGFVYDKNNFNVLHKFDYQTEGWGITHDGNRLIMSDGTSSLYFLDPGTFEVIGKLEVIDGTCPVKKLNELEYVKGEIFANVWQTDRIARIEAKTGMVNGWIDLKGLLNLKDKKYHVDVLNGIAYDEKTDRLFVTGKLWPQIFEIKLTSLE